MEASPQEIRTRYNALNPDLKDFLNSEKEVELLGDICEQNQISEKFFEIQKNIALAVLGINNFNDFRIYILSISQNEAQGQKIYQQIFNMIFLPIMHLISGEGEKTEKQESAKVKEIPAQDNIPFIDEKPDLPPPPQKQNPLDQIKTAKELASNTKQDFSQYHDEQDAPKIRKSFDSYRESVQ